MPKKDTMVADAPILAERMQEASAQVEYFKDYRPTPISQRKLPMKPEYLETPPPLDFSYFRADQVNQLDASPNAKYFRVLKRDDHLPADVIRTHPEFADKTYGDIFVGEGEPGYPFDTNGLIAHGGYMRVADRECRECYLAVRPIAAKHAEHEMRAKLSAEWSMRPEEKAAINMDVTDPVTGEKLLTTVTANAPASGDSRIVTSGSFAPQGNGYAQMAAAQK